MKKEAKNTDVTITDEGKVVVDLKGEYDYNGVNVLMDKQYGPYAYNGGLCECN
jgi:hypothetical protein